ncbi:MAG: hypothetical protein IIA03_01025 [Proteobacteria bacterium]|nr:hypothetical protein [Pseudomonadota bacterium]
MLLTTFILCAVLLVFAVVAGIWLIGRFDVYGAVAAAAVSGLAMNLVMGLSLWRSEEQRQREEAEVLTLVAAGGGP